MKGAVLKGQVHGFVLSWQGLLISQWAELYFFSLSNCNGITLAMSKSSILIAKGLFIGNELKTNKYIFIFPLQMFSYFLIPW